MSKELKAVKLHQPDIPFTNTYIFAEGFAYKIFHNAFNLEVSILKTEEAEQAILCFDNAVIGKIDKNNL